MLFLDRKGPSSVCACLDCRTFFVFLQIMKKDVLIKLAALLLTVWYSMSIIGFDVHTCSGSDRSFVAGILTGRSCEDIHPEHMCSPFACCADGHDHEHVRTCCEDHSACAFCDGVSIRAKSCCSNDYQVLSVAGTIPSDDQRNSDESGCFPVLVPYAPNSLSSLDFNLSGSYVHEPGSGLCRSDRQAALSVWRI